MFNHYLSLAEAYPPLTSEEERVYVAAAACGNRQARDRLVLTYARWIVMRALKAAKPYPQITKEDAIQVGFVAAMDVLERGMYDPNKGKLNTYLSTVVRRRVLDTRLKPLTTQELWETPSREAGPEEKCFTEERAVVIRQWVENLPDRQKEVLTSHFGFEGDPTKFNDISRKLGVCRQRAQQILANALKMGRADPLLKGVA